MVHTDNHSANLWTASCFMWKGENLLLFFFAKWPESNLRQFCSTVVMYVHKTFSFSKLNEKIEQGLNIFFWKSVTFLISPEKKLHSVGPLSTDSNIYLTNLILLADYLVSPNFASGEGSTETGFLMDCPSSCKHSLSDKSWHKFSVIVMSSSYWKISKLKLKD